MEQQIVFFDDKCVLCSRSVQFIFRYDRKRRFFFASFDSEAFSKVSHLLPLHDRATDQNTPSHLRGPNGIDQGSGHSVVQPAVRPDNSFRSSPDSVVLYRNGRVHFRSGAALRIAMLLRFPLPLLAVFLAVPAFIRNAVYDWIARNRYRWFGKRETCFLPDNDLRERFLE